MTAPPARAARVARHAHRGSVVAAGFALDVDALGEAEARRRVLALWAPGVEVQAAGARWLVRLPRPRRVRVDAAPGAPLVEVAPGVVAALPLSGAQLARLDPSPGAAVIARDGVLAVIPAGAGVALDPAGWLALDDVAVATVDDVGPVAAAPRAPVVADDVRAVLGVGAAAAGAGEARAALARALRGEPAAAAAPARGEARAAGEGDGGAAAPGWWSRLTGWMTRRRQGGRGTRALPAPGGAGGGGTVAASRPAAVAAARRAPRPPSLLDRMRARLARALWRSPLGEAIGRRHADYLRDTLAMFDRGDLDAALRRAIPLGGGGDGPVELAVSTPAPRTALSPSLTPPGAGASIPVVADAIRSLRARYEAARDRLVRDGRVVEAAFVVADLLGDAAAAVALLERHGQRRLAAELAEARGLDPALVVRQWFVAGDAARAALVAWRTGAFADAVARAAHRDPGLADGLRLLWARSLADAGEHARAVEVARRARVRPPELPAWLALGIAGGGVAAARLAMLRVELEPDRFAEARDAARALFERTDDETVAERIAAAGALTTLAPGPAAAALARPAARAMVADVGRGVDGEPAVILPRLLRLAGDPALRADVPALAAVTRAPALVDRDRPVTRRWARGDAGAAAVRDAALLPGGRVLVALGELGVALLAPDGRVVARWDQPAEALVVSDAGTRAIAMARRGQVRRLARLDLATRTARTWCELALDDAARTYDGRLWLVAAGGQFLALDATRDDARAAWGVQVDPTPADGLVALSVARAEEHWLGVASDVGSAELWQYEGLTLRGRRALPPAPDGRWPDGQRLTTAFAANPEAGGWLYARVEVRAAAPDAPLQLARELITPDGAIALSLEPWQAVLGDAYAHVHGPDTIVRHIAAAGRVVALAWHAPAWGVVVEVWYLPARRRCAVLALEGATAASLRFDDYHLVAGDDLGRVVVLDLRSGEVRRDLRVAPP